MDNYVSFNSKKFYGVSGLDRALLSAILVSVRGSCVFQLVENIPSNKWIVYHSLQCFDTVGWATGRASGV